MTREKFQIAGDRLIGHGLVLDVQTLGIPKDSPAHLDAVVDAVETVYRQGRDSLLLSYDDRYLLHGAIETLRGLAVVVGSIAGDRHRNAADALARLLHQHEEGA